MKPAPPVIRLSAPAHGLSWAVPVLYEDEHLLALDKPARLLSSPDRYDPARPNLMRLLHEGVAAGRPWAASRGLTYLANAHRLDFETTGVFLLAKCRDALVVLANHFGSEIPKKYYVALAQGRPAAETFSVEKPLAADRYHPGLMRIARHGKKSATEFRILESFPGHTLLEAQPHTGRTHQIRVHLKHAGLPILGDRTYGGGLLYLSSLKPGYRQRPAVPERPLIASMALHAWRLELPHPVTGGALCIEAPWPRELQVALKYLRRFASIPA
ncbi:MAG: RNA pseudouridine synthase [Verrucomicrobiae bacterium]|nr:RNA pseudouridine synthase [Verrucomicrobiae bacterium]